MRVGQGFDVHQLVPNRKLIIGGVTIDFHLGLMGHSDADVLIHAIMDALLGAAGLGDIGQHFPDSDATFKNIDSRDLLKKVIKLIELSEGHDAILTSLTDKMDEETINIGSKQIKIVAKKWFKFPFLKDLKSSKMFCTYILLKLSI